MRFSTYLLFVGITTVMCSRIQCIDTLDLVAGAGSTVAAVYSMPTVLDLLWSQGLKQLIADQATPLFVCDTASAMLRFCTIKSKKTQVTLNVAVLGWSVYNLKYCTETLLSGTSNTKFMYKCIARIVVDVAQSTASMRRLLQ